MTALRAEYYNIGERIMNKLKAIILTLPLALALSACAGETPDTTPQTQTVTTAAQTTPAAADPAPSTESATVPAETSTNASAGESGSALAVLEQIWAQYDESQQFPAGGGDPSEANSVMDGPGRFSLDDPSLADSVLGMPESAGSDLTDAASLVHMMNANTFTAGAFQAAAPGDAADLAEQLRSNIQTRQWMCGFPEKLLILSMDDCVVSAFGNGEMIELFKTNAMAAFGETKILVEEPIR